MLNIYIIPSIAAIILNLLLVFVILRKNPNSEINRVWAVFLIFVCIYCIGEFGIKFSGINANTALLWHKLVSIGGNLMVAAFLHFTLIYPKRKDLIKNNIIIFIIYIISLIFLFYAFIFSYYNHASVIDNIQYNSTWESYTITGLNQAVVGSIYFLNISYIEIFIIIGFLNLLFTLFKTTDKNEKKNIHLVLLGTIIFLGMGFVFDVVLPIFSLNFIESASLGATVMAIFVAYAISRYKLMTDVKLVTEEIPSEPIDYELDPGFTYIIPESKPKLGFQLFGKTLKGGVHGIVITMRNPKAIRNKYGLKRTPIIWITENETFELSVKPSDIVSIKEILKPFFERSTDSVIMLIDDKSITGGIKLEEHSKVLDLSKTFFDTVMTTNSRFIISVSPHSISPKKRMPIIKTKTPLLEFSRLASFVFEDICNNILQFLIRNGYVKQEDVRIHLNNLKNKDSFFRSISYKRSYNPVPTNGKLKITNILEAQRMSKQILIDKLKLFISEFENIETAMDLNSIGLNAITKYGLSKNEFQLHIGDTYLMLESEPRKSFEIFSEFVSKDYKGLCITKSNPKKLLRKFSLNKKGVKTYWLTDISESKKDILPPKLEHILSTIEDYLATDSDKKVILLDGIEYLIFYSGDIFDAVLGFLRRLTDRISEENALILIPLDPTVLNEQRISLLKRSGIEIYRPN